MSDTDVLTTWGKVSMEMDSQRQPLVHLTSQHLISSSVGRPPLRSAIPHHFARPCWDDMRPCHYSCTWHTYKYVYCDCIQTRSVAVLTTPSPNTYKLSHVGQRHCTTQAEHSTIRLVSTPVPLNASAILYLFGLHSCFGQIKCCVTWIIMEQSNRLMACL